MGGSGLYKVAALRLSDVDRRVGRTAMVKQRDEMMTDAVELEIKPRI